VVDDPPGQAAMIRDTERWLESLAGGDTLSARATIVPPTIRETPTGGHRALALLEQIGGRSPASSAQLRTGAIIAQGGMGVIRTAEQVALGRTVAVKTLKPELRGDPRAALDLLREAWITGAIEHPNVVPIHHVGLDDDGNPVIVLKRITGAAWTELIRDADAVRARFDATDLLAWNVGILIQVLNAIAFAHDRGILHRDLKPDNVMIGEFGEVYLLDWGIAVSLRDDGSGRLPLAVHATEPAGTPVYMAPEMVGGGATPLSERTDIYLVGAVVFELLAGRPPHEGTTAIEVLTNVVLSNPQLPPDAPPELARICLRAIQRDPALRHASARALQLELQAYLEHRGSARVAAVAEEHLASLLAVLAARTPATAADPTTREQVHRLFGACRFGFHESLASWRDNVDARAGLVRATVAVADFELACGDPHVAVSLLSELDAPPLDALTRARDAAASHARRQGELERLERQHDPTIGARTRAFVISVLGVLFVTLPALAIAVPDLSLRFAPEAYSFGFLVPILGLGWWARESLMKTAINRRAFATMVFMFSAQGVMAIGARHVGMTLLHIELMMVGLWTVTAGIAAIAIDRRLALAAIGYAAAFVLVTRFPEHRLYAMSAANLVFVVNAVWTWRPRPA
jgi:serine/threonine-protein kinase